MDNKEVNVIPYKKIVGYKFMKVVLSTEKQIVEELLEDVINGKKAVVIETQQILGQQFDKYFKIIDGKEKCCWKKRGEQPSDEEFIFDWVFNLVEINFFNKDNLEVCGDIYYKAKINDLEGHIKLGEENLWKERIVLEYASEIYQLNTGISAYYGGVGEQMGVATIDDMGNGILDKICVDKVDGITSLNINGKIVLFELVHKKNKWGWIVNGQEKNWKKYLVPTTREISEKLKVDENGRVYYEYSSLRGKKMVRKYIL